MEPGQAENPAASDTGQKRARQASVLVFGKALSTISDALVPILVVRLLDKTEVGILSAVLIIYATASLVLSTGFPAALFHFLPARDGAERAALARRFSAMLTGLGTALGILFLASKGFDQSSLSAHADSAFDAESLSMLAALSLYPLGDLPIRLLPNLLVIEDRAGAAAGIGVLRALGTSTVTLVPILMGLKLEAVFWGLSLFGVVELVGHQLVLRSLYRNQVRVPCPVPARTIVRFSIPLGLTDVVSLLNNRLDRYLIGIAFPPSRLAEYHAGAWQVPVINEIPYAVGRVYASDLARLFEEGRPRDALALWRGSIHKVAVVVVPLSCVFLVAAEECMDLLFTAEYAAASNVFRAYAVLTLGRVAAFGTVIIAAGRPRLVFHAALFTILANVVISAPLLYFVGFLGPAIGTAIAFVPTVWFYCWCIGKAAGVPAREVFPLSSYFKVLGVGMLASAPAVAYKLMFQSSAAMTLLVVTALILGTYAVLGTWLGQITREDWRFALRTVRGRFTSA